MHIPASMDNELATGNRLRMIDFSLNGQRSTAVPSDVIMTSLSRDSVVAIEAARTICCDVTLPTEMGERRRIKKFKSSDMSTSAIEGEFRSHTDRIYTTIGELVTSTANDGEVLTARALHSKSIEFDLDNRMRTVLTTARTADRVNKSDILRVSSTAGDTVTLSASLWSTDSVTSSTLNHTSFPPVATVEGISNVSSTTHDGRPLPNNRPMQLALRSAADNSSVSAAVGSNMADRRTAGSGLQREEMATVGAAVAAVAVFWSLLALALCAVVRMRKRKHRQRLRGRVHADADAQTAMMEAMVRAELARGRSRVSDTRVPPTYVNVTELLPVRTSSTCDLDMSDFFHLVLDNQSDFYGVWKKQRYNDVISGRSRDQYRLSNGRWQDSSGATESRQQIGLVATTHRANNRRRIIAHEDDYCLLNGARDLADGGSGQLQCNGLLTKVKSLDSVCKVPDELVYEGKCRQRTRRRRRYRIKRSASTSRCLVSAAAAARDRPTALVNSPANGNVIKSVEDDDVTYQLPVTEVAQAAEYSKKTLPSENKSRSVAILDENSLLPANRSITHTPEVVRKGEKLAEPEVCSLGSAGPAAGSPVAFVGRGCGMVQQQQERRAGAGTGTTHLKAQPQPLHRLAPSYSAMTSTAGAAYTGHLPRLLRCTPPPPPPPPPPPLPGQVMRLFVTPSNTKSPCLGVNASLTSTAGRPARFPRMGHTGLATSNHRTTLQFVKPDSFKV